METRLLLQFKNLIEFKSAYRALIATLAIALPALVGFSFLALTGTAFGVIAAFFHGKTRYYASGTLWLIASTLVLCTEWVLASHSSFFDFLGVLQFGFFAMVFLFFTIVLRWGQKKYLNLESVVFGSLVFLGVLIPPAFLGWENSWAYPVSFAILFVIHRAFCNEIFEGARKKVAVFSLFGAYLGTQCSYVLTFVSISPIIRSAVVVAVSLLFLDMMRGFHEGVLTRPFFLRKLSLFIAFIALITAIFFLLR